MECFFIAITPRSACFIIQFYWKPIFFKQIYMIHRWYPNGYYYSWSEWIWKKIFKCSFYFSFGTEGVLWIELPWPENPVNTCVQHTNTLDSCFDLVRSHQLCIPWSPPLEIEPATTECRTETLPLSYQSTSHTSNAKLTNKVKIAVQCFRMLHASVRQNVLARVIQFTI